MTISISLPPAALGLVVVISLIISKYFEIPALFLVVVILAAVLYQVETNRFNKRNDNIQATLINVSKFIILTGISGYALIRIIGIFFPEFD